MADMKLVHKVVTAEEALVNFMEFKTNGERCILHI